MAIKINENRRCVIISGAPGADPSFIRQNVEPDDYVICADMGFETAVKAGVTPCLLVGDFDSYTGAIPAGYEVIGLCPEKDYSDTFHAVQEGIERGFRCFALLAATGGRLDHTLANLSLLEYIADNGAQGVILSENEMIRLLQKGEYRFENMAGKTFSVFAFGCKEAVISYSGAKYPLKNGKLLHGMAMGLSNIFTSGSAEITVHRGQAVIIINTEM